MDTLMSITIYPASAETITGMLARISEQVEEVSERDDWSFQLTYLVNPRSGGVRTQCLDPRDEERIGLALHDRSIRPRESRNRADR